MSTRKGTLWSETSPQHSVRLQFAAQRLPEPEVRSLCLSLQWIFFFLLLIWKSYRASDGDKALCQDFLPMGRSWQTTKWESFSVGGGKSRKIFLLASTVSAANPRGMFGGESAECVQASQAAERRDGEDTSIKCRFYSVCETRQQNRWSGRGSDCLMDQTDLVTPALSTWDPPLVELDTHLHLPLLGRKTQQGEGFRGTKIMCNQHICWGCGGVSIWLNSLT